MLNKWCDKIWLYVTYAIGAAMVVLLMINWGNWSFPMKLMALSTIVLPAHIFEEWQFPAGFHYQYNTAKGTVMTTIVLSLLLPSSVFWNASYILNLVLSCGKSSKI